MHDMLYNQPHLLQETDPRDVVEPDWIEKGFDPEVLKHELSPEMKAVKEDEVCDSWYLYLGFGPYTCNSS